MARRRKMTPERKEFIDSLIAHYNPKWEKLIWIFQETVRGALNYRL